MGPKRLVRHRNICACRLPAAFSVSCCGSMSSTSWLGSLTHDGEACDSSTFAGNLTSTGQVVHDHGVSHTFGWGVALSMVADAFIAIALCIQKHAHNINKGPDGKPVVSFLKLPIWWAGILLNVFGEAGNAYAYSLAPASVVAPVGSISVVVNEIICVTFLKEPLRRRDMVGLCAVIGGVVLVILGVPESSEELSVHHILSDDILFNPTCYWWMISLLLLIVLFTCYLEPRYAQEWILVWLLLCSSISSITVAACRSFFSLVNQVPADCAAASCVHGVIHPPCTMTLGHYLFWVLLLVIIVTAVWSAMYLNKAMMVYGNSEVVPVYYCTFTVFSITGGALIYNELGGISAAQAVMFGMGVLCAFTGVAVLMSGRAQESAAMLGGAKQLTVVPPEEEDAEAGAGVAPGSPNPTTPQRLKQSPSMVNFIQRSASKLSPSALKGKLPEIEVTLTFRDLDNTEKLSMLEQQPSSSSLLCGGIGASLQQASTETVLASDRERALLQVQAANYPGSLQSARRMNRKGRLSEKTFMAALGERAVAAFSAMAIMESSSLRRTKGKDDELGSARGGRAADAGASGHANVSADS